MSTITKLDNRIAYEFYLEAINLRIKLISDALINTRDRINYIAGQLYHVGKIHGLRNEFYVKIVDFIEGGTKLDIDYLNDINIRSTKDADWFIAKNPIIVAYFKSIIQLFIEEYNLESYLNVLNKSILDYQTYYRILISYYFNVSNKLLIGEEYVINGIGVLQVVSRKGKISKNVKFKPDWGESLNLLKLFAKKNYPDIYNDYQDHIISKQCFIERLKPYCYNPDTNPTGFKWLVHRHDPSNAWICLYKKRINNDYNIAPSNFVMNETRSQVDFTNNINSVSEIFETNQLGFRDKLNCLNRFDPEYINNFKEM